jgi:hypothetical protein
VRQVVSSCARQRLHGYDVVAAAQLFALQLDPAHLISLSYPKP